MYSGKLCLSEAPDIAFILDLLFRLSAGIYAIWAGRWKLYFGAKKYWNHLGRTKFRTPERGKLVWPCFFITGRMHMGNRIAKESMEFIAGEIIDAVLASDSLEDGINLIQEILESNGIVEIISD